LNSINNELRTATEALLPQLRADHEAAAALCLKLGLRSCKELREAKMVFCVSTQRPHRGITADDLALLGTLHAGLGAACCQRSRRCASSSQQPAPVACSGWRRGWARARCRP
jgi:hypothetical protein